MWDHLNQITSRQRKGAFVPTSLFRSTTIDWILRRCIDMCLHRWAVYLRLNWQCVRRSIFAPADARKGYATSAIQQYRQHINTMPRRVAHDRWSHTLLSPSIPRTRSHCLHISLARFTAKTSWGHYGRPKLKSHAKFMASYVLNVDVCIRNGQTA